MIWRDESVTVVELDGGSRPQDVLAALRVADVGDIDLLVVHQSSYANASLIGWMRSQRTIVEVWAPETTMGVGEIIPSADAVVAIGGIEREVTLVDDRLQVVAAFSG